MNFVSKSICFMSLFFFSSTREEVKEEIDASRLLAIDFFVIHFAMQLV